jgi:ankyrin repeat protein
MCRFRWAVCQLDMIAECRNLAMLRKSLATLPQTLDQTYDRILTGISEKDRTYAIRILQWLTFSARPLHLEEVAEVVAIDVGREPVFDRDEVLLEPLEALDICSSLVTITADKYNDFKRPNHFSQIVTLAHYSVQEYLVSARIKRGPAKEFSMQEIECHEIITKGCIGYLNQFQQLLTVELHEASALAYYSAEFWTTHFQKTRDGDEDMSLLAMDLMSAKSSTFANWISLFDPDNPFYGYHDGFGQINPDMLAAPLYYAALLGLTTVTKLLLHQDVDINAKGGAYGNALHAAVATGHSAVVKLLIKAKANVKDRGGKHYSALHLALHKTDVAVFKLLIDAGADVNMRDEEGCSVLQTASELGNEAVAKLLIEAGADVNAPGNERFISVLQAASAGGHTAMAKLLIDAGAEVNAQDGAPSHALRSALRYGHETTAILLIKEGANVGPDGMLRGALHHSVNSKWCTPTLVDVLLQYGAPSNTIDVYNMTPLHYCVKFEHETVAKQLIDAGVPIDSRVCRQAWPYSDRVGKSGNDQVNTTSVVFASATIGLTPLHFAALKGKARMIKFLLGHGADPNAVSEYCETPLHLALSSTVLGIGWRDYWNTDFSGTTRACNDTLDALLADPRINLRMTDVTGKGPLHCMHYGTSESAILVRKLISRGADLSSVNSNQESPLHLAIEAGDHDSVTVLLSMGANLSLADKSGLNILHYVAAKSKNHEILVAILESEQAKTVALVTSKDRHGRNVLHHLLSLTSRTPAAQVKTVQWLLEVGANGSDLDHSGISPLGRYVQSRMWTPDVDVCKSLLHVKGSASFVGSGGQNLGHLYARRLDLEVPILNVLNRHGVDLAAKDWDGRTVLHYAVMHNSPTAQVLRYLVDVVGIQEDEQDKQGRTALQYAIEKVDEYRDRGSRGSWEFRRVENIKLILSK